MEQAIERHAAFLAKERRRIEAEQQTKAKAMARAEKTRMAEKLAAEGRGDDTEVAHVTPGEIVIPRVFQTPEVLAALAHVAAAHGVPLDRFRVGDARNSVNPNAGAPEFDMSDRDLDSIGRAIAISQGSMLSGDPWSSMSSNQWTSMPINIGQVGDSLPGSDSTQGASSPYRDDGPVTAVSVH